MDISFYVNHLIHLVLSIIVQNQGNNVRCAIKCGQVLCQINLTCIFKTLISDARIERILHLKYAIKLRILNDQRIIEILKYYQTIPLLFI